MIKEIFNEQHGVLKTVLAIVIMLALHAATPGPAKAMKFTYGSYAGNGGGSNIPITVGFQPDVVIIKASNAQHTVMRTATMSGTKELTAGNALQTSRIVSLDPNGFTVGTNSEVNGNSGNTYYWMAFKDTGDGDLNVNSYGGDATDGHPITTGFQPDYVIVMSAGGVKAVQRFSTMASLKSIQFDGAASVTGLIKSFTPTGFTVGTDSQVNSKGTTYHYVAWKAVTGSMKVGSYNGTSIAQAIGSMGFQPNYLIIKGDSNAVGVHRSSSLTGDITLRFPNSSSITGSITDLRETFTSTDGFQVGTDATANAKGTTYYWAAFDASHDASKLAITSVVNAAVGVGFAVTVQAQKADGTPVNVAEATGVQLSLKTGNGSLGGTLTGTIAANSNQFVIHGVTYSQVENSIVLTASRTSGEVLTAADSSAFNVVAQPTISVTPSTIGAGGNVTVAWNGIPNPATTNSFMWFGPGDPDDSETGFRYLNCTQTTGAAVASGSCPLSNFPSGSWQFRLFEGPGAFNRFAVSNTLTVNSPTKLVIASVNNGANPSVGGSFPVAVQSQDSSGNAAAVSNDTTVSLSLKTGSGALGGTLTGTISAGTNQITISGVTYSPADTSVVITATATSGDTLTAGDSASFAVIGSAVSLAFTTQPGSVSLGTSISGPPTVAIRDSAGNVVTSSSASISMSIGTNPSGAVLSGTTTKSASSGIASFNDLSIDKAANGYTLVAASTGLTSATSNTFSVTAPDLMVTVISNPPATAAQGTSFSVTDTTANNGNTSAAASTTNYRLSLDNVITTSDPLLTGTRSVPSLAASTNSNGSVNVTIPAGLASGTYFLGACADSGGAVAESNETNNCLASTGTIIVSGGATITSLLPASGPVGFSATINGFNFGATQGTSTVTFNNTTATPASWSATSIVVPVPAGATTGPVVVTVGGIASNGVTFTVTLAITYIYDDLSRLKAVVDPTGDTAVYNYDAVGNLLSIDRHASSTVSVVEFQPKSGPANTTVTIQGSGFSTTPNQNTITFNGTATSVSSATIASLTVTVPPGATSGLINVTAPGGSAASSVPFTVTASSAPTISSFNPTKGTAGTSVAITGTNFNTTAANNNVRFNSALTGVTSSTATTINTTVPNATGSGKISVTTPRGSATSSADFFVPPAPFTAADVEFTARTSIGSNVTVNITTVKKIGLVVFDGTAGQWINVQMGSVTFPDRKSNVNLLKPNGSVMFSSPGVPQAGASFKVQLPDTGSYSLSVNGIGSIGSINLSVTETTPGSNPLSLSCDGGSCVLACGVGSPSLTFAATGGKPPYNWSTTKGTITPSVSDRSRATLTPPPNTGGAVNGDAYVIQSNDTRQDNTVCANSFSRVVIAYKCDDSERASNGGTVTFPSCPSFDALLGGCDGLDTTKVFSSFTTPSCGLPVFTDTCAGVRATQQFRCDKRSPQMISAGCNPCGVSMIGTTVTVTDANGNFISQQPLIMNQQ